MHLNIKLPTNMRALSDIIMKDQIEAAVISALECLLEFDNHLLVFDVNERSISHRLAVYLEQHFPGWNVDCEYNRDFDDPKRLDIFPRRIESNDTQATTVFPDIIVHRRGTAQNLLVIEMKKSTNQEGDRFDFLKLKAFKTQLNYQFAVFIEVETNINQPRVSRIELV